MLFRYILRKLRFFAHFAHQRREKAKTPSKSEGGPEAEIKEKLQESLKTLKAALGNSNDVNVHPFRLGTEEGRTGAIVFIDGLVSNSILTEAVLRPLKSWRLPGGKPLPKGDPMDVLEQEVLCAASVTRAASISELAEGCLWGDTALLLEGCASGLIINSKGWEKRAVAEPQTETVVRGPREGFTENLRTNTSLIRRKIRNGLLRVEQMTVGRKTRTAVCLMYLSGVTNPKVLEQVKYRISRLDVESILESGYIEEYIEDAPFSPFSTIGYSEKPDVVAARMLEGRVAILVDGTPFVLTAPMLFVESFQTAEDYYARPLYASLTRLLRFAAFFITIFGPAIYIAMTEFHHELIPTTLLFTIAKARQGTPFSAFVEALIMIFAFQILQEAGIRLPRPVGQAISIVGALIMGDAAVSAGLVGAPMVITMAITAVTGFLVPSQTDSGAMLRIVMMVMAACLGFFGITFGFLAILIHLATLESFGVPYFDIFSRKIDTSDTIVRTPLWARTKRPRGVAVGDTTRGHFFIPPLRPFADEEEEREGKKE